MKQYITQEQVNTLSADKLDTLVSLVFSDDEYWGDISERIIDLPNILSLGRMIELLNTNTLKILVDKSPIGRVLNVVVTINRGRFISDELCDALFMAIEAELGDSTPPATAERK